MRDRIDRSCVPSGSALSRSRGVVVDVVLLCIPLLAVYAYDPALEALRWRLRELITGLYAASVALAVSFGERRPGWRVSGVAATGLVMAIPFFSHTFDAVMGFGLAVASGLFATGLIVNHPRAGTFMTVLKTVPSRLIRAAFAGTLFLSAALLPLHFGVGRVAEGQFTRSTTAFIEVTYTIVFGLIAFDWAVRALLRRN